jgi:AraC-like DNA-binding protein
MVQKERHGGSAMNPEKRNPIGQPFTIDNVTNGMLAQFPIHCVFRDTKLGQPHLHSHSGFELYLCVQGSGRFLVGDRVYDVSPGTLVIVKPMVLHLSKPDPRFAFHRFVLSIDEGYIAALCQGDEQLTACLGSCLPEEESALFQFDARKAGRLQDMLLQLEKELQTEEPFFELSARSLLLQIFTDLARTSLQAKADVNQADGMTGMIERILRYLAEHHHEEIQMDWLADHFRLSRSYLYRVFKQHTGYAPNEYLTAIRINKAKALLLQTKHPVIEVAGQSGFHDVSHFCHTFKKHTSMTPSRYRSLYGGSVSR